MGQTLDPIKILGENMGGKQLNIGLGIDFFRPDT